MAGAAGLPFDLTGCTVTDVAWPARGFRLTLDGTTAAGRDTRDIHVRFDAVANRHELAVFLKARRKLVRKGRWQLNTTTDYPLKLPARLTALRPGSAADATYSDPAFADAYAAPEIGRGQRVYLFALAEKRFKNQPPFPIVCARVTVAPAKDEPPADGKQPPAWSAEDCARLGRRFLHAVVADDLPAAAELLSRGCRKRLGKTVLAKRLGEWLPIIRHPDAPSTDELAAMVYVHVEDDPDIVWEAVQRTPAGFPREAVRAQLELGAEFLREAMSAWVLDDAGELRLDLG